MHTALGTVLGGLLWVGVALGSACSDHPTDPTERADASELPDRPAPFAQFDSSAASPDAQRDPAAPRAGNPERGDDVSDDAATSSRDLRLPTPNAALDYQLGGAYAPPPTVAVVSRDREETPAAGLYNICYVNAFQSQAEDQAFWLDEHPDLVLHDDKGHPVIDSDWDELLFDIRTPASRAGLLAIVGPWIEGCARAGFDAVEIDNLDSYARSGKRITQSQAVQFMRLLADTAHASGLAIAQKNAAELLGRRAELDTDFAVVEECNRYDECADFTDVYGDSVLVIEYRRADFNKGCKAFPQLSIVLRDRELVTPASKAYVYAGC